MMPSPYQEKKQSGDDTGSINENLNKLSVFDLLKKVQAESKNILKKEIDLAKAEIKADIKAEIITASGLIIGVSAAFITLILLLVTAIFALSLVLPGWIAGFIISGLVLIIGIVSFLVGWNKRMREPLTRTKEALKAGMNLTKDATHDH